jgi:hypothetical protein
VGNGLVDAANTPAFKEDVVAFRVAGVGIALQVSVSLRRSVIVSISFARGRWAQPALQNKVRNDCYHFATEFGASRWYELARSRT